MQHRTRRGMKVRRRLTLVWLVSMAAGWPVNALSAQAARTGRPPVKPKPTPTRPSPAQPTPTSSRPTAVVRADSAPARALTRDSTWRWTTVTYLSGESIYLDAGTLAGLREKSRAELLRHDTVAVVLEIQFVASSRAAARIVRGDGVVVGDSVRFRPVKDSIVVASSSDVARPSDLTRVDSATSTTQAAPAPRRSTARAVSGRIGLRYLMLQTGGGASGRVTQPALDIRFEGHRIGGSALGLVIDARAHRQQSGSGRTDGSTRVYQSSLEYQGAGAFPVRVTAGRQLSNVLSPLGFFDGVTLDVDRRHWRVGALGGTQPDYTNFLPSGAIREAGAWVQWHTAPGSRTIFHATAGGVGSYGADGVNREFALLSTMLVTPVVSVYTTQELDVNRGWKQTAESGKAITPTSTFATLRVALSRAFSVQGGYDSRRSVRLYRDFLTPDIAFDDAFRRGYWAGAAMSIPHLYVSADSRISDGLTVGRNQSSTASISLTRITRLGLGLRARGTQYDGPTVSGTLTSASVEADPWGRFRIEATVGRRDDRRAQTGMIPARTTWVGFDADAGIGRSWYLMASSYREVGASERMLQQYLGLSWRY